MCVQNLQITPVRMISGIAIVHYVLLPLFLKITKVWPGLFGVAGIGIPLNWLLYRLPVVLWWMHIATIEQDLVVNIEVLNIKGVLVTQF